MENKLINFMEVHVTDLVERTLKSLDICSCDQCKLDMVAITLNTIPPKYYVTNEGELYARIKTLAHQLDVDIYSEIARAAEIVSNNPRH